jgi:protein-tyrosine phosphatase
MGNICRSPSAEAVFRAIANERAPHLALEIDSAGTHDYHVGKPPDPRAIAAAHRRGIDLTPLRARAVQPRDFAEFDLMVAMDEENVRYLQSMDTQVTRRAQIRLMMDFASELATRAVPDPYYGGEEGFEEVLDLLQEASNGLLRELLEQQPRIR